MVPCRTCVPTRSSGTNRSQSSGQAAEPLAPELDRAVALGDEAWPALVGLEAELRERCARLLLGGDVDADAARAALPLLRRADDDGGGDAVGADRDLSVAVGGVEAHAGLHERAAGAHAEGRGGRRRRRSGSDPGARRRPRARSRGRPCMMSARSSLIGSAMVGERSSRRSAATRRAVDAARDALLRVDVPARPALEPAPAEQEREAAFVVGRSKLALTMMVSPPTVSRSKRGGAALRRSEAA
jgi:hypothetical protein